MKKQAYLFALILALCCCGCSETSSFPEASAQKELETQAPVDLGLAGGSYCVDLDTTVYYDSVSEFLDSEFCMNMKESGFAPYLLSYDESRYEFYGMRADGKFYDFQLKDTESGLSITCSVSYSETYHEIEDLYENTVHAIDPTITAVEKDGVTYDVAVHQVPFEPEIQYNITYIPMDGYTLYIGTDSPTPEEAIAYIHEFDLVPAAQATEAPTEQTPEAPTPEATAVPDVPEETTEETKESVSSMEIARIVEYDTVDEFLASDFCKKMKEDGFTPYILSYDEERFELKGMHSDASFYVFGFHDKEKDQGVSCTLMYNTYMTDVEQMMDNIRVPVEHVFTTVEKDGVSYEVYAGDAPFDEWVLYNMGYLPFEKWRMSINSDSPTPEEAIAYIHEFDLVPAE